MTLLEKLSASYAEKDQVYDEGLRKHMLSIYNYMTIGIMITLGTGMGLQMLGMPAALAAMPGGAVLSIVLMFAPLAYVFFLGREITAGSIAKGQVLFWSFCALMGVTMAFVFEVYTGASIAVAFLSTAIAFAGLSLHGYTTKADLSPYRSFLIMGVWGLIGAGIVNIFFGTELFTLAISAIGVLIFAALTVVDTQDAKRMYREGQGEMNQRAAIWSALALYLDFINMMLYLLRFIGIKKD